MAAMDDPTETSTMYGQLLAMAIASEELADELPGEHELLRRLAQLRDRLALRWAPGEMATVDAVDSLATHVEYDRALIRLCRLRGIACSPDRFTRPEAERRRLEAALAAAGVPLAATGAGH